MAEQQVAQDTTAPVESSVEDRIAKHLSGEPPAKAASPEVQPDEPPAEDAQDADPDDLSDVADQLPDDEAPAPTSAAGELELLYNGQPLKVPLDEARNLAQLGKLYTDKREQSDAEWQTASQMLANAQTIAQQMTPQLMQAQGTIALYDQALGSFDVAAMRELARSDPAAYLDKQAERDSLISQRDAAVKQFQSLMTEAQQKIGEARNGLLSREAELAQRLLPRLKSAQADTQAQIREYLQTSKARPQTAEAINSNAELLAMAYKAAQYDKLQTVKHQRVKDAQKAPAVLRPGSSATTAAQGNAAREQKLRARLKNTGSPADFAALLLSKGFK